MADTGVFEQGKLVRRKREKPRSSPARAAPRDVFRVKLIIYATAVMKQRKEPDYPQVRAGQSGGSSAVLQHLPQWLIP